MNVQCKFAVQTEGCGDVRRWLRGGQRSRYIATVLARKVKRIVQHERRSSALGEDEEKTDVEKVRRRLSSGVPSQSGEGEEPRTKDVAGWR